MTPDFKDHFSVVAGHYRDCRPGYPPALFQWLSSQCFARDLAWDCGAGNGQASTELARHFNRVIATDASAAQIAQAEAHPAVEYRVMPAEASGLESQSADLVVVAQALHWFDLDLFYAEVARVLKPGGLVAVWCYGIMTVEGAAVDAIVQEFYSDTVGPYWPPERRHVETGYRDLPFPFVEIASPPFVLDAKWDLAQLLGYFRSWSATAACIKATGTDPVTALAARLAAVWGGPGLQRTVEWSLAQRVGSPA